MDAVTIPVVGSSIPKAMEGVINESDSEGEELNVNIDIPLEMKEAAGALSSSVEVDSGSPTHEPNPVATVEVQSQPVLVVKPAPLDDKVEPVKGKAAFQSPQSHNNKGNGKKGNKKGSNSSKRRNK